jgi:hypothetical protein
MVKPDEDGKDDDGVACVETSTNAPSRASSTTPWAFIADAAASACTVDACAPLSFPHPVTTDLAYANASLRRLCELFKACARLCALAFPRYDDDDDDFSDVRRPPTFPPSSAGAVGAVVMRAAPRCDAQRVVNHSFDSLSSSRALKPSAAAATW